MICCINHPIFIYSTSLPPSTMNPIPLIANPIAELSTRRDSIVQTIAKLTELSQKLTYQSIERVNSVALFSIKAKHPQEVTVEIGGGYFAEMTANQAIALYQRRLKNIEAEIAHRNKESKQKSEQKEQKESERPVGMAKTAKLEEGGKRGYMEVIGEENGQEIFNIVEIQGEEDEEQNVVKTKQPEKVIAAPPLTAPTAPKQAQQKPADKQGEEGNVKAGVDSEASFDPSEEEEDQGDKSQKSAKSNESDSEPQDLIQYHRKHIIGIKPTTSLPQDPNSSTNRKSASKSEGVLPAGDTASPVQSEKKKKRVSFADERDGGKLQQLLKEEETRKEKKAKNEQPTKSKQTGGQVKELKQLKQVKVEKGVKALPDQPVAGKVSKFKLQRMKQRMQREGK